MKPPAKYNVAFKDVHRLKADMIKKFGGGDGQHMIAVAFAKLLHSNCDLVCVVL